MKHRTLLYLAAAITTTAALFAALWALIVWRSELGLYASIVLMGACLTLWRGVWRQEVRKEDLHG